MGQTITPKYRMVSEQLSGGRVAHYQQAWNCQWHGKPTAKNLAKYIEKMQESYGEGGCNHHITKAHGEQVILQARIETNVSYYQQPEVKATWVRGA